MTDAYTSLTQIKADIAKGKTTVETLVKAYLGRIDAHQHLNAFNGIFKDDAAAAARQVDIKLKNGSAGKLAGMVIGIKDNICYKGHKVTASSKILENFTSIFSSTVVEVLLPG